MSVVVPARDAESTLGEALSSVEAQSLPATEVIVVDDGSVDATAELASSHGARVIHQEPAGPSAARNRGIHESVGEWIAFLDADDVWHPHKLEAQMHAVSTSSDVVAVASDWVRPGAPWPERDGREALSYVSLADLFVMNRFQTSTVMARAATLRSIGGFRPALDGAEDWDCWLRLSRLGSILKLDWPYVAYRDSPGGVSKDLWQVYERMWEMLSDAVVSPPATMGRSDLEAVLAWHHLRFAVNWLLEGDRRAARSALGGLSRDRLVHSVPRAFKDYLAPFLWGRVERRLRAATGARPR